MGGYNIRQRDHDEEAEKDDADAQHAGFYLPQHAAAVAPLVPVCKADMKEIILPPFVLPAHSQNPTSAPRQQTPVAESRVDLSSVGDTVSSCKEQRPRQSVADPAEQSQAVSSSPNILQLSSSLSSPQHEKQQQDNIEIPARQESKSSPPTSSSTLESVVQGSVDLTSTNPAVVAASKVVSRFGKFGKLGSSLSDRMKCKVVSTTEQKKSMTAESRRGRSVSTHKIPREGRTVHWCRNLKNNSINSYFSTSFSSSLFLSNKINNKNRTFSFIKATKHSSIFNFDTRRLKKESSRSLGTTTTA